MTSHPSGPAVQNSPDDPAVPPAASDGASAASDGVSATSDGAAAPGDGRSVTHDGQSVMHDGPPADATRPRIVPGPGNPAASRAWWALCAPLFLALAAVLSAWGAWTTPAPASPEAAGEAFSAARAREHITRIAERPHPAGSTAHEDVQQYVTDRLKALGLRPDAQDGIVATPTTYSSHLAGRVRNITATIPGRDSTGTVLLVAHTDSVPGGPGASDNGLGVSALLETARALTTGPRPRNDVMLLFTDGEEPGRLGATAFTGSRGRPDPSRTVVLNLDARGTSGRAVMFETGRHSGGVVPALAGHPALATSLSRDIYRLLPNETDFTSFRDAGYTGLNFAVVGGSARYHTPEDSPAHADSGSLQDLGEAVLGATRRLAGTGIPEVTGGGEATYFTVAGTLVRYPQALVLPLALLALAVTGAALWWARRRAALRRGPLLRTAAALPLACAGAAGAGWAAWQLALLVRPEYAAFLHGSPYRVAPALAGLALLTVAVCWLWLTWVTRRATALEAAAAVTAWCALLAVVTAALLPGASYLFSWPALAGAAGLALAALRPEKSPARTVIAALCGLPAVVLLVPTTVTLLVTLGPAAAAAPLAVLTVPVLVALLSWGRRLAGRAVLATGLATALIAATVVGAGAAADGPTADRPTPVGLMYALDADRQQAHWVTDRPAGDPWVDHYADDRADDGLENRFPTLYPTGNLRTGKAPRAAIPVPELKAEEARSGDVRTLRLRLGTQTGRADLLALYVNTEEATVEHATVEHTTTGPGKLPGGTNRPFTATPWKWGLVFGAPGRDGAEITLTVRSKGPVRLLLVAQTGAVPAAALDLPRPATRTWAPDFSGAVATRTFTV